MKRNFCKAKYRTALDLAVFKEIKRDFSSLISFSCRINEENINMVTE